MPHTPTTRKGDDRGRNRGVEPGAGTWKTWVLSSGNEIPVPPPPKGQAAKRDLDAVVKAAAARTDETLDAISFWDTGSPGFRWNQIGAQLLVANPAPDMFRVITYLNLAIYDATIAAWAWKQHYRRQRPERAPAEDGDRHTGQPVVPERTRRGGRRGGRRARPPLPGHRRPSWPSGRPSTLPHASPPESSTRATSRPATRSARRSPPRSPAQGSTQTGSARRTPATRTRPTPAATARTRSCRRTRASRS